MKFRLTLAILLTLIVFSCSNDKKIVYEPSIKVDPFAIYKEAMEAFEINDFFYASKKFSEAELNFTDINLAAKSAIMSSFSLYGINFYTEALENLERYLKKYPADKNVIYAHYLISIIYFEQISDEKKDLAPLIKANEKIDFFLKNYPNSEYAIDLRFKKDLIQNQLAAKELFVARFYISTKKWVPAINRLKVIVKDYDQTIFIEEALHRLVEINYHLGLENEARKYANILGYNYNSSEWFEQSYKILNRDYEIKRGSDLAKSKNDKGFINKILEKIR
tara:strand:+ start:3407 stop:4240 length:834 start_codon:yes stop_codon:yes gene_type:complete